MNTKPDIWEPMRTAPRDGTGIVIRARGIGIVAVCYLDCEWLRQPCPETGQPGDPEVADCWRITDGQLKGIDVELDAATGWRPGDFDL